MICLVSIPLWFDSNLSSNILSPAHILVSIPLWFDSNMTLPGWMASNNSVSIPLWFDSNCAGGAELSEELNAVSIPLWFDSNRNQYWLSLCSRQVSIPLWFDSNRTSLYRRRVTETVSIPLWFDSNQRIPPPPSHPTASFNSTLVRFKLSPKFLFFAEISGFNSTLVRFKLSGNEPLPWMKIVSIPLWFDSNGEG